MTMIRALRITPALPRSHYIHGKATAVRIASATVTASPPTSHTAACRRFGSHDDSDYLTGTVKFYLRDRLYGFIVPDDPLLAKTNELWCHRTGIVSSKTFDESPSRPYLRNKERVKFRVQASDKKTPVAVDIVFENGRPVPLFRTKCVLLRSDCVGR